MFPQYIRTESRGLSGVHNLFMNPEIKLKPSPVVIFFVSLDLRWKPSIVVVIWNSDLAINDWTYSAFTSFSCTSYHFSLYQLILEVVSGTLPGLCLQPPQGDHWNLSSGLGQRTQSCGWKLDFPWTETLSLRPHVTYSPAWCAPPAAALWSHRRWGHTGGRQQSGQQHRTSAFPADSWERGGEGGREAVQHSPISPGCHHHQ